jgi:hypothetical protein
MRTLLVAALLPFGCGTSFGQSSVSVDSASWVMAGCRAFVANGPEQFTQGFCVGAVRTIVNLDSAVCPPSGAAGDQGVRIVIQYIDSRPARLHEKFAKLASEALRAAWPCHG